MEHLAIADQGAQPNHLQIFKMELIAVMGLGAPFGPEPFHLILNFNDGFRLKTKLLCGNNALRSKAAADDICGNGIDARLGNSIVAIKIVNTRNGKIALKSLLAAQMRLLRNPVFEGAAQTASFKACPWQRVRLINWLGNTKKGFQLTGKTHGFLQPAEPRYMRPCTSTGPRLPSRAASSPAR